MTTLIRPLRKIRGRSPDPHLKQFRADVLDGLRKPAKELPCKYFYDEHGSKLFDAICELDEYYLTRTELAIMREQAAAMAAAIGPRALLIEFGSGSSLKTRLLLDELDRPAAYVPVDISGSHLAASARRLAEQYPGIDIRPVCADFTGPLELPECETPKRRVVYFPGSTIGNFGPADARRLLRHIRGVCGSGGGLLVGIDLKKDVGILEAAYNDRAGVTAEFNLNVLRRINRELGADFRLDAFAHRAFYNAGHGRVEMHLVSRERQTVHVGGVAIPFAAGETIHTECSYKYAVDEFCGLAAAAELKRTRLWTDREELFAVMLFEAA